MGATLEDLDRRVTVLETVQGETTQTLRWVVAKLGRIQAVQDEHTLRLERVEQRLDKVEARLDSLEAKVDSLPRAIAELIEASERRVMTAIAQR
jgi:septal ring factor EnvC (AmiA/AmiB activator)